MGSGSASPSTSPASEARSVSSAQKWRIRRDHSLSRVRCPSGRLVPAYAACPLGRVDQAPTPSPAAMKVSCMRSASSPLVRPRMTCPSTDGRRSRLRCQVLNGSEKDADGGERKGGGKGRDGRLANMPQPLSNTRAASDLDLDRAAELSLVELVMCRVRAHQAWLLGGSNRERQTRKDEHRGCTNDAVDCGMPAADQQDAASSEHPHMLSQVFEIRITVGIDGDGYVDWQQS